MKNECTHYSLFKIAAVVSALSIRNELCYMIIGVQYED